MDGMPSAHSTLSMSWYAVMHDIGKSGWSLLIAIIPIIGSIILLIWEVKDSDQNANQYGESPKYEEVNV